jgi:hypothetical protein
MKSILSLSSLTLVVCILSISLGAVIFVLNALRKDPEYEVRFAWWVRLLLYMAAFVIPPVGLLACLGLSVFGKARVRFKLAKGLLFVSLIPSAFYVAVYVDPSSRVTDCSHSIFRADGNG